MKSCSRNLVSYLTSYIYVFSLLFAPAAAAANERDIGFTPSATSPEERVEGFVDGIKGLQAQLQREQFIFADLVEAKEFDADKIIAFTKNEITFQPYAGALKGTQGVLLTRSGNSLDQAIFLGKLLKDAGLEARVVQGVLDKKDAGLLLSSFDTFSSTLPEPFGDEGAAKQALNSWLTPFGFSETTSPTDLSALYDVNTTKNPGNSEVPEAAARLLSEVQKIDKSFASRNYTNEIVKNVKDYFWVQYRMAAGNDWKDAHPIFPKVPDGFTAPKVKKVHDSSIPEKLHHRLEIKLELVQLKHNKPKKISIAKPISFPIANALEEPIRLMFYPNTLMSGATGKDIEEAKKKKPEFYFPYFGKALATGAKAFDRNGLTVSPDEAMSNAAGVIKTVANKGLSAANALSALGSSKKEPTEILKLGAVNIHYKVSGPGRKTKTITRAVYDSNSPRSLEDSLAREWLIVPSVGPIVPSAWMNQVFDQARSLEPLLKVVAKKRQNPEEQVSVPKADMKKIETSWQGHYSLYRAFEANPYQENQNQLSYRPAAALVALSRPLLGAGKGPLYLDILDSPRTIVKRDGDKWALDRKAVLAQSVWESYAEGAGQMGSVEEVSAFSLLEKGESKKSLQVVEEAKLDQYPEFAAANMRRELKSGFSLLSPPAAKEERLAWWKIDRETGEAIATLDTGIGGDETVEYKAALGVAGFLIGSALGYGAMSGCKHAHGKDAMCCYMDAGAYFVGGLALGGILAYLVSSAAALIMVGLTLNPTLAVGRMLDLAPSFCH